MPKKLLFERSATGVEHHVEIDPDGDVLTTVEHTPTSVEQSIMDSCHDLRGMPQNRRANMRHVARIPINTYNAWKKEWREQYSDKLTWQQFEVMKLNDPNNARLRTDDVRGKPSAL